MKPELIQYPRQAPPSAGLSPSELERYLRRAHYLRAAAFSRLLKSVAGRAAAVFRWFTQARDRRAAMAELRRLDARALKDIGVERSQIPMIVESMLRRRQAEREPGKAYPLRVLTERQAPGAEAGDQDRCPPLAA